MKSKIIIGIFLLLASWLAFSFFSQYESYESVENEGWSDRAHRNPYLAAEQFINKTGIKVTSSYNFEKLSGLPENGMVFISNTSRTMTRKHIDELLAWVKRGGHLIIAAPVTDKDETDPLLSRFDVSSEEIDWFASDDEELSKEERIKRTEQNILRSISGEVDTGEDNASPIPEDEITRLKFNNVEHEFQIHFSPYNTLSHPSFYEQDQPSEQLEKAEPFYWAGTDNSTHFLQFNAGNGLISVISDKNIWTSSQIGKLDHAYFLWFLSEGVSEVVLLYGVFTPSLLDFAMKYTPEFLLIFSLWLAAWLIYRGRRFSPVRKLSIEQHRSIAEHINASAEYLWNEKHHQTLIEPVRQEVLRQLQHHHQVFIQLNQQDQIQYINQLTRLDKQRIDSALFNEFEGKEVEFTIIMQDLQTIRNTL